MLFYVCRDHQINLPHKCHLYLIYKVFRKKLLTVNIFIEMKKFSAKKPIIVGGRGPTLVQNGIASFVDGPYEYRFLM